jgi:hypothetical protein
MSKNSLGSKYGEVQENQDFRREIEQGSLFS